MPNIRFEWDGTSLQEHFSDIRHSIPRVSRGVTEDLLTKFHEEVKEGTPPVELKASIMMEMTDSGGFADTYSGAVYTDKFYASFVEYGTGLYGPARRLITPNDPNGVLSWEDPITGERIYAKSTKGQKPQYMFYTAELLMRTRLVQQGVAEPRLKKWAWGHSIG